MKLILNIIIILKLYFKYYVIIKLIKNTKYLNLNESS